MIENIHKNRKVILALILITFVSGILFYKPIDIFSKALIDKTFLQTTTIYVTARGINAAVSVLQTAEIGTFVSITIGEMLDPINDLIERFSTVLTWSLGSLALQKILLATVSANLFQVFLSLLAGVAAVAFFVKARSFEFLAKVFATMLALRFGLAIILSLNAVVSELILKSIIADNQNQVEQFSREMKGLQGIVPDDISQRMSTTQDLLEELVKQNENLNDLIPEIELDLVDANEKLEALIEKAKEDRPWYILTGPNTPKIAKQKEKIDLLEAQLEQAESDLNNVGDEISAQRENIECLNKLAEGRSCADGWISGLLPDVNLAILTDLGNKFEPAAISIITLLVSILLQSIVMPLLFLWMIKKSVFVIWQVKIPALNK